MREFYRHGTLWIIIERKSTFDLEYFQETKKGSGWSREKDLSESVSGA